jgi:predicted nucleic acid-binding protein
VTDLLIDSNVLLDVFTEDPRWFGRSAGALAKLAADHDFVVNPIVYAEV